MIPRHAHSTLRTQHGDATRRIRICLDLPRLSPVTDLRIYLTLFVYAGRAPQEQNPLHVSAIKYFLLNLKVNPPDQKGGPTNLY